MHRAAAARAGGIFRFDDDLDPRQMLGQRAAPRVPLFRSGLAQRRIGLLLFGLALGNCCPRSSRARLNWSRSTPSERRPARSTWWTRHLRPAWVVGWDGGNFGGARILTKGILRCRRVSTRSACGRSVMSRAARCAPSRELNVAHFIRVGLGGLGPGARGAMRTSSPGSSSHDSGGVNREQRLPRPLCVRGSAGGAVRAGCHQSTSPRPIL